MIGASEKRVRPISFKKATKAQKREFMDAIENEMTEKIDKLAHEKAQLLLPSYIRPHVTLDAIRIAAGWKQCSWLGVPVTEEQFNALVKANEHRLPMPNLNRT